MSRVTQFLEAFRQSIETISGRRERVARLWRQSDAEVAVFGPLLGEHANIVAPVGHLPLDATVELVLSFAMRAGIAVMTSVVLTGLLIANHTEERTAGRVEEDCPVRGVC